MPDSLRSWVQRYNELAFTPDGQPMEQTAVAWRNRCLESEHKLANALAELAHVRNQLQEPSAANYAAAISQMPK